VLFLIVYPVHVLIIYPVLYLIVHSLHSFSHIFDYSFCHARECFKSSSLLSCPVSNHLFCTIIDTYLSNRSNLK